MTPALSRWATRSGAQGTARIADLGPAWVPVGGDGRYGAMLFRREEDGMTYRRFALGVVLTTAGVGAFCFICFAVLPPPIIAFVRWWSAYWGVQ